MDKKIYIGGELKKEELLLEVDLKDFFIEWIKKIFERRKK